MPCSPVQSLAARGMLEILNGIFTKEIGFYTLLLVAILRHIRGVTDRDEIQSRSAASEKRAEFLSLSSIVLGSGKTQYHSYILYEPI